MNKFINCLFNYYMISCSYWKSIEEINCQNNEYEPLISAAKHSLSSFKLICSIICYSVIMWLIGRFVNHYHQCECQIGHFIIIFCSSTQILVYNSLLIEIYYFFKWFCVCYHDTSIISFRDDRSHKAQF